MANENADVFQMRIRILALERLLEKQRDESSRMVQRLMADISKALEDAVIFRDWLSYGYGETDPEFEKRAQQVSEMDLKYSCDCTAEMRGEFRLCGGHEAELLNPGFSCSAGPTDEGRSA